ncbi:MAG: helix-turn-helix domain-containing protein [Spirochaetota bacterium]
MTDRPTDEAMTMNPIAGYTSGRMNADYQARLNRVIDYIDGNLTEQLDLDALAGVASFSRYHFHRVFSAVMGETPGSYIQRLRLEKAAGHVAEDERPITEIAMDLGFSSPSVFSRAFSDYFGVSPNRWRHGGWKDHGTNSRLQSNRYQPLSNLGRSNPCLRWLR